MAKFKFVVGTGYVGSEEEEIIEIPDEKLEGLDEEGRIKLVNEWYEEWVWQMIDSSSYWKELDK